MALGASALVMAARPIEARGRLLEPSLTLSLTTGSDRVVALTLDACSGGFDRRVAEALIAWSVPATLFLTARWIASNPQGLSLIRDNAALFAIGNHGAAHIAPVLGATSVYGVKAAGDLESIRVEVQGGAEAIRRATGVTPKWYRGATALYSPEAIPVIEQEGFALAGFSLNGDDGASLAAAAVIQRFVRARHGDVIIAHINQPHRPSGAGVVAGIRALLDQGVKFTKLEPTTPVLATLDRSYL